ncbi:unnamed protein product [Closterium sp. Naga37s-1]|nr:unnamed protein product [Closterium sp. Naga37s-1]
MGPTLAAAAASPLTPSPFFPTQQAPPPPHLPPCSSPIQALWAIQQWDRCWLLLQRRKCSLCSAYERPRVDEDEEAERQLAMQGVLHALHCALSEPAVQDVDAKFNLQFPPEEAVAEEGGRGGAGAVQRRPRKRSMYSVCRRAGLKGVVKRIGLSAFQLGENLISMYKLGENLISMYKGVGLKGVVKRIGLSAFQLGENLISMYKQHEVEDTALSPDEVATEYICAEFPSPALVLRGARHMAEVEISIEPKAEVEISIEPKVREHVREIFNKRAIVSTNPTPRGRQVIDTFHRFAGIERLKDKPVGEFRDDQWLLIAKAESQGLVKVEVGLPPAVVQENVIQVGAEGCRGIAVEVRGNGGEAKPVGEFRDETAFEAPQGSSETTSKAAVGHDALACTHGTSYLFMEQSGPFKLAASSPCFPASPLHAIPPLHSLPPPHHLRSLRQPTFQTVSTISPCSSHNDLVTFVSPCFHARFPIPASPRSLPPVPASSQEFEAAYLSDGVSHFASLWNEQRRTILRAAIAARLLPTMHKETRLLLTGRAKAFVAEQCALSLWKHVSVAPFDVRAKGAGGGGGGGMGGGGGGGMRGGGGRGGRHGGGEEHGGGGQPWLRVMACCWGPGNPATTFAMLNAAGEMVDFLHTGFLCARTGQPKGDAAALGGGAGGSMGGGGGAGGGGGGGGGGEQQVMVMKKREDERRLMAFVKEHKPHVVVVGGANLACERLKDEIWEVCVVGAWGEWSGACANGRCVGCWASDWGARGPHVRIGICACGCNSQCRLLSSLHHICASLSGPPVPLSSPPSTLPPSSCATCFSSLNPSSVLLCHLLLLPQPFLRPPVPLASPPTTLPPSSCATCFSSLNPSSVLLCHLLLLPQPFLRPPVPLASPPSTLPPSSCATCFSSHNPSSVLLCHLLLLPQPFLRPPVPLASPPSTLPPSSCATCFSSHNPSSVLLCHLLLLPQPFLRPPVPLASPPSTLPPSSCATCFSSLNPSSVLLCHLLLRQPFLRPPVPLASPPTTLPPSSCATCFSSLNPSSVLLCHLLLLPQPFLRPPVPLASPPTTLPPSSCATCFSSHNPSSVLLCHLLLLPQPFLRPPVPLASPPTTLPPSSCATCFSSLNPSSVLLCHLLLLPQPFLRPPVPLASPPSTLPPSSCATCFSSHNPSSVLLCHLLLLPQPFLRPPVPLASPPSTLPPSSCATCFSLNPSSGIAGLLTRLTQLHASSHPSRPPPPPPPPGDIQDCRALPPRPQPSLWHGNPLLVIFKIVKHFPRDLTSDVDNVRVSALLLPLPYVVFQDETLALLYENSAISQEHLPSQPGKHSHAPHSIVRRTVGLGRYMQNRLALAACLFGPAREVLSAKFHRLQDLLPPDDVYDALERVMVTVTNQVGVDVNYAAQEVGVDVNYAAQEAQDWLFAPLQFVCGLRPRKASTLKVSDEPPCLSPSSHPCLIRLLPLHSPSPLLLSLRLCPSSSLSPPLPRMLLSLTAHHRCSPCLAPSPLTPSRSPLAIELGAHTGRGRGEAAQGPHRPALPARPGSSPALACLAAPPPNCHPSSLVPHLLPLHVAPVPRLPPPLHPTRDDHQHSSIHAHEGVAWQDDVLCCLTDYRLLHIHDSSPFPSPYPPSRSALTLVPPLSPQVVFINAAAFIRVRGQDDMLDDSRIHPADYRLALKVVFINAAASIRVRGQDDMLDDSRIHPADYRLALKVVFINAAASIRVRGQDDMLDDSRIHPADYRLALKVATDGYCEAHRGMTPHSVEERGIDVVLEARDNPDLIRRLDFEDYAVMLARKGQGGLKEKLLLIRRELMHGFAECRVQFESLNADEQFWLLSGETEESVAVGKVVTATVKRVLKFKVLCALESGVLGEVDRRDFSDDPNVELRDVVTEGQPLTCRIKEVKTEEAKVRVGGRKRVGKGGGSSPTSHHLPPPIISHLPSSPTSHHLPPPTRPLPPVQVILTCKGSDLRSSEWREMRQWDPYYQRAAVEQEEQAATEERKRKEEEKRKTAFRPRMITYPLFHNVSLEGAKKVLADKDVGSVVIRPSSRGPTHLSITMKLPDGAFTHVDVHEGGKDRTSATSFLRLGRTLTIGDESYEDLDEGGKDRTSATSFLRLGRTLTIGDESYEDLDEVMARYIEPLAARMRDMAAYRKFRQGSKGDMDALVRTDKEREPARIPYYLSLSHDHPGAFMLTYIRSASVSGRPVHEYITGEGEVGGTRLGRVVGGLQEVGGIRLDGGEGRGVGGVGGSREEGKCGSLETAVGVVGKMQVAGVVREGEGEGGGGGGGGGWGAGSGGGSGGGWGAGGADRGGGARTPLRG